MRTIKFKDLLNSIDGITKGPFGGDVKKSLFVPYSTGCYKVYEQGVVANNNYLHGDYYLPKEYVELKLKKFILEPGDILITGAGTLGLISIVPENIQKGIINQALIRIRLNEDIVDKMFFKYFFPYRLKKYACRLSSDSVIPNMPPINVLKEMPVELPELNVQKKITSILNKIDTQIERNNTMVQKLQDLGNTIYCNYAKSQKDTFNIQEKAEIIWGQCPLGENLLENPNEKSIKYASGAGDIDDNITSVIPKGFTDDPLRIAKEKDICISVAGTVGKIGVSTEDIAIGRAMLSIRNSNLYGYLYFAINSYKSILSKQATGAIQKIINNSHLEIINIPVENKKIVNILNNIIDETIKIEKNTIQLNQLKNKLLPLLINGQLEV